MIDIKSDGVSLRLNKPRGKVRIADENGNHIARPTQARNISSNLVEWMITNAEIDRLVKSFLGTEDKELLIKELEGINGFIKDSKYATREAIKTTAEDFGIFKDFKIYKYTENFYSFERELVSKIKIRITFKMGDFTLAPHMFVIISFDNSSIVLKNIDGIIQRDQELGINCIAIWKPGKMT